MLVEVLAVGWWCYDWYTCVVAQFKLGHASRADVVVGFVYHAVGDVLQLAQLTGVQVVVGGTHCTLVLIRHVDVAVDDRLAEAEAVEQVESRLAHCASIGVGVERQTVALSVTCALVVRQCVRCLTRGAHVLVRSVGGAELYVLE